jgi:hypothetical protein
MSRPARFEHYRYLGDKRSLVVHDLDNTGDACQLDELLTSEQFLAIAPQSLAEAKNRGFHPCKHCVAVDDEEDVA